jgi:hypothetical protein
MQIKRVQPVPLGKIVGVLSAIVGLFELAFTLVGSHEQAVHGWSLFSGAGAVLLPIVYGVGGFLYGLIVAVLYNILASLVGGIVIEVE